MGRFVAATVCARDLVLNNIRGVAGGFNRVNNRREIWRRVRRPADDSLLGIQIHARALDAGHTLNGLGYVARAIGAAHAVYGQFCDTWN